MLRDRGPRMLEDEPRVTSAVDIFVKDLGIVLEAGRGAKAALPLAGLAHQLFLSTSGRGEGAWTTARWCALSRLEREPAEVDPRVNLKKGSVALPGDRKTGPDINTSRE